MSPVRFDAGSRVEAALARLLGDGEAGRRGVLHVCSTALDAAGTRRAIRIGPRAPTSATDFFVLNAARARAQAILTTGRILRSELDLRHALQGPRECVAKLVAYRREVCGLLGPALVCVLTESGDLPGSHPTFSEAMPHVVITGRAGAERARATAPSGVEVIVLDAPSVPAAVVWLADARALTRVSVEAGPSSVRPLYLAGGVDELWRATYCEPLTEEQLAGEVPSDAELRATFERSHAPYEVDEPSGRWRFERWVRASHGP